MTLTAHITADRAPTMEEVRWFESQARLLPDDEWHMMHVVGNGDRVDAVFVDGEAVKVTWRYRVAVKVDWLRGRAITMSAWARRVG